MLKLLSVVTITLLFTTQVQAATASWYGGIFHGRMTASGEIFNKHAMTCASNTHKLGTVLEVTNRANQKKVRVRVTDTGGFSKYGRTLDLSRGAFAKIADVKQGLAKVDIKVIK